MQTAEERIAEALERLAAVAERTLALWELLNVRQTSIRLPDGPERAPQEVPDYGHSDLRDVP